MKKMKKLIFEMIDGRPYVYTEDLDHHRHVDGRRRSERPKLDPKLLDRECWANHHGDNYYMVFDVVVKS